jgi:hypothetical protein
MFAGDIGYLLEHPEGDSAKYSERTPDELSSLLGALERARTRYRDVVHGDKRISEMRPYYDEWVAARDEAFAIRTLIDERAARDPRQRRGRAVSKWIADTGLPQEQALEKSHQMDPVEWESLMSRYEAADSL